MIPLSSPTSVLLAGGGSAGHVSPLLAMADEPVDAWRALATRCGAATPTSG